MLPLSALSQFLPLFSVKLFFKACYFPNFAKIEPSVLKKGRDLRNFDFLLLFIVMRFYMLLLSSICASLALCTAHEQPVSRLNTKLGNKTLIYIRIQKTASKTLVNILESPQGELSNEFGFCVPTGWIGMQSRDCKAAVKWQLSSEMHRNCLIDGHCAFDSLVPPKKLIQPFIITMLRDPVSRTVSEYRHVLWNGAWDYSTSQWLKSNCTDSSGTDFSQIGIFADKIGCGNSAKEPGSTETSRMSYDATDTSSLATMAAFIAAKEHENGMDNRQVRANETSKQCQQ